MAKPGESRTTIGLFAQPLRQRDGRGGGRRRGGRADHDLQQRHRPHRVEEVQADEAFRRSEPDGELADRNARCVRREQPRPLRLGRGEHVALQGQDFGHRLHQHVGPVADRVERGHGVDPGTGVGRGRGIELAASHRLVPTRAEHLHRPGAAHRVDFHEIDVETGGGGHVRDSGAHRAAADHRTTLCHCRDCPCRVATAARWAYRVAVGRSPDGEYPAATTPATRKEPADGRERNGGDARR